MGRPKMMLVTCGDANFITGTTSANILSSLKDAGRAGMTYDQLHRVTKISTGTLYVLAGRLRKAKLIVTDKDKEGNPFVRLENVRGTKILPVLAIN